MAILARDRTPVITRCGLPGDPSDTQARYVEAAVDGVLVASIYLPNGNPNPGAKFDYKLAWFERMIAHAASLRAAAYPSCSPATTTSRRATPTSTNPTAGRETPSSRRRRARPSLLDAGWTDALRAVHSQGPLWTYWSYLRQRWSADKGLRLDHLLLSPDLQAELIDAGVNRWVRGEEGASDHAPVWIELGR